jgi:hypothetical protein
VPPSQSQIPDDPGRVVCDSAVIQLRMVRISTGKSPLLGSVGIPGFRGLDSWGVRLEHDRDAGAHIICRHKNVILIVTNRGKTAA